MWSSKNELSAGQFLIVSVKVIFKLKPSMFVYDNGYN